MKKLDNKWLRGALPALLIHCSIGSVYCWSYFSLDIAAQIGQSQIAVEWAFSLAIFFLGMSAAFAGNIVEKNVKHSSRLSMLCFTCGLILTGVSIHFKSLIGIYLSYGCLMGIGLGIGYISPVKTLMLWFQEQKGLATGLAVAGFGLAKVIASPLIVWLEDIFCGLDSAGKLINGDRLPWVFVSLALIYAVCMFIAQLLIKKPDGWKEPVTASKFSFKRMFKEPIFIGIWLMIYINIACGLALISQEKSIMNQIGLSAATIATMGSVTAVFNAGGRVAYSALADKLTDRNLIYKGIFILSILLIALNIFTDSIVNKSVPLVLILLCVINANYGGGFSNLPTLLSDRFGMRNISKIHGLSLTAWAIAGLTGNQISAFIITRTGSINNVFIVLLLLYIIAMVISFTMVKNEYRKID